MIHGAHSARHVAWVAAAVAVAVAARRMPRALRVVVEGESMLPTLAPGDRLVVVAGRGRRVRPPATGDLVVTPDPRDPTRVLVKRVATVGTTTVELVGDNAGASTDSRAFGTVALTALQGRAVYRYAPGERAGWLRRPHPRRPASTIAGAWRLPE